MTPEIKSYIDSQIRQHRHDGNLAQRVDFSNLFGQVATVSAAPTSAPVGGSPYDALKIYNGGLYWFDFSDNTWHTAGSGTPGGSDTDIQFNDSGGFGGDPKFTWNTGSQALVVGDGTDVGSQAQINTHASSFNYVGGKVAFNLGSTEFNIKQSTVNTTNATVTTLGTYNISGNTTTFLESRVIGTRTGGSSGAAGDRAAYVRRALYNGTTLIGAVQDNYTAESQGAWDCTFNISGGNALLQVTGAANNDIRWDATTFTYFL